MHLYGSNCFDFKDLLRKAKAACKMVKYTKRLYGFANWRDHCLDRKLIVSTNKFGGFQKFRQFRFHRVEKRDVNGVVESWSTLFQMRRSPFHENWVDLDMNVNRHIKLALKPLTFQNLFGGDLSSLNYVARALRGKKGDDGKFEDPFTKMCIGVQAAEKRFKELVGDVAGRKIADGLRDEINLMRTDVVVPFDWDLSMYRKPPINWDPAEPFVSQLEKDMRDCQEEAVEIVNLEDAGGPINLDCNQVNIGDYVLVAPNLSCDAMKRPFWLGQVTYNYCAQKELKVHWLLPPTKHVSRTGKVSKGKDAASRETEGVEAESTVRETVIVDKTYISPAHPPKERAGREQEPNRLCRIKNYPYCQFKAVLDINTKEKSNSNKGLRKAVVPSYRIGYGSVYFSFERLAEEDTLPHSVLDAISASDEIQWKG